MQNEQKAKQHKEATLGKSILCITLVVAFICVGMAVFAANIAVVLFLSWLIVWPFAASLGYSFSDLEKFAAEMGAKCIGPATIILAVGMMIASFMASGTVPTILVIGLHIINPTFFLVISFLLCCIMSVITGTSWGTLGTVGIAMIGVGAGLGVNPAITAGAIVSGSWFGDKMSPLSDSTIMCSTITNTYIMDHIKAMMHTTIPAALISLVLYLILGFSSHKSTYSLSTIDKISSGLGSMFHLNIIALLPIVIVIILMVMKKGTVVSLLAGTISAGLVAICMQGFTLTQILNFAYNGFSCKSSNKIIVSLLNRGGIISLISLLAVFIGGLGLGGILQGSGLLKPILKYCQDNFHSPRTILLAAWVATLICILVVADNNFAFVMVGTLFAGIVKKYNLKSQNLSRILEDVGTLGSALIPWNVGAQFAAGVLGVTTISYTPYAFLNYITPIISLLFIIFQINIVKISKKDEQA